MKTKFIGRKIDYDGSQLSSHWAYRTCNLLGDSAVAFVGACDVSLDRMVDLSDVKEGASIRSREMLHFIIEHFDQDLEKTILRQRLFAQIVLDELCNHTKRKIRREGDDLYDGGAKLCVSIATASPVSTLIHFGINISSRGTPVKTRGLNDYRIKPKPFALAVLKNYTAELDSIADARCKVRGVE